MGIEKQIINTKIYWIIQQNVRITQWGKKDRMEFSFFLESRKKGMIEKLTEKKKRNTLESFSSTSKMEFSWININKCDK